MALSTDAHFGSTITKWLPDQEVNDQKFFQVASKVINNPYRVILSVDRITDSKLWRTLAKVRAATSLEEFQSLLRSENLDEPQLNGLKLFASELALHACVKPNAGGKVPLSFVHSTKYLGEQDSTGKMNIGTWPQYDENRVIRLSRISDQFTVLLLQGNGATENVKNKWMVVYNKTTEECQHIPLPKEFIFRAGCLNPFIVPPEKRGDPIFVFNAAMKGGQILENPDHLCARFDGRMWTWVKLFPAAPQLDAESMKYLKLWDENFSQLTSTIKYNCRFIACHVSVHHNLGRIFLFDRTQPCNPPRIVYETNHRLQMVASMLFHNDFLCVAKKVEINPKKPVILAMPLQKEALKIINTARLELMHEKCGENRTFLTSEPVVRCSSIGKVRLKSTPNGLLSIFETTLSCCLRDAPNLFHVNLWDPLRDEVMGNSNVPRDKHIDLDSIQNLNGIQYGLLQVNDQSVSKFVSVRDPRQEFSIPLTTETEEIFRIKVWRGELWGFTSKGIVKWS